METLKEVWEALTEDPVVLFFAIFTVVVIGLSGWIMWTDYRQCLRDGNPAYLCRGLLK